MHHCVVQLFTVLFCVWVGKAGRNWKALGERNSYRCVRQAVPKATLKHLRFVLFFPHCIASLHALLLFALMFESPQQNQPLRISQMEAQPGNITFSPRFG